FGEGNPDIDNRVRGKMRREMLRDADRSHAGATPPVRDAEGLVEVQVADVGTDVARAAEADLRVHVGAVHVDLAAVLVHDAADLDRKSTRLNSSHGSISYAVFCLKKKRPTRRCPR